MTNNSEILDLTKQYLIQQSELFGDNFYLDIDIRDTIAENKGQTLEEFYLQIKDCEKCKLAKNRTKFVFGIGNPSANLMCIGEGPGVDEDRRGEPFVGAAGQLLSRILAAIGFKREEVYIANIVKCHPPGNRDPEPEEIVECLPYLKRQIEMIQPKVILALGRIAAQTLLNTSNPLGKLRGQVHEVDNIKMVVTYHPAALLRNPQWKIGAWQDVQLLRKIYDQTVDDKPFFEPTQSKLK